jgi:NADH-ubiquinone oxidoreductase chain 5
LGLVSFCLVVYYNNRNRLRSGILTIFTNRLGDGLFLLSFFFMFLTGTFFFDILFGSFYFLYFLIFFGGVTKSAQIPFSSWLPAAIAAPTPVSSLVHSSTLVTAGVYVLIRFNPVLDFVGRYASFFCLLTMFLGGLGACFETDLKKVVAISTLSQLGLMVLVLSFGMWEMSYLHMVIHAFFKSILFLSSGYVIYFTFGGQDFRASGGFRSFGLVHLFVFSRVLCLIGFPFLLGFYSKDTIIRMFSFFFGVTFYSFFMLSCVLTVFYRLRFFFLLFSLTRFGSLHCEEESVTYFFSSVFLFFFCCFLGFFYFWFFLSGQFLFLRGPDYILGIVFLLLFFFNSFLLDSLHFFYSFFYSMVFLKWLSSGGLSSFITNF